MKKKSIITMICLSLLSTSTLGLTANAETTTPTVTASLSYTELNGVDWGKIPQLKGLAQPTDVPSEYKLAMVTILENGTYRCFFVNNAQTAIKFYQQGNEVKASGAIQYNFLNPFDNTRFEPMRELPANEAIADGGFMKILYNNVDVYSDNSFTKVSIPRYMPPTTNTETNTGTNTDSSGNINVNAAVGSYLKVTISNENIDLGNVSYMSESKESSTKITVSSNLDYDIKVKSDEDLVGVTDINNKIPLKNLAVRIDDNAETSLEKGIASKLSNSKGAGIKDYDFKVKLKPVADVTPDIYKASLNISVGPITK